MIIRLYLATKLAAQPSPQLPLTGSTGLLPQPPRDFGQHLPVDMPNKPAASS